MENYLLKKEISHFSKGHDNKMAPKKFFIAGCQRSGTTLLRLILESHSDIACKDEPGCYEILSDGNKLENLVNTTSGKKWIGFKIPRFAEQLGNETVYDYGTPNVTKPFKNFYRGEPVIFIIRDVRDAVCSMMDLKADEKPWVKRWAMPIIDYWIENSKEFRTIYSSEISKMRNSKYPDLATCSLFWKFKNASYFRYLELGFPMLKINYEELATSPRKVIISIMSFLGLDWQDALMTHHLVAHPETDKDDFAIGRTNSRNPISSFHISRYKQDLTEEQSNEILSISGDLMKSFGYI